MSRNIQDALGIPKAAYKQSTDPGAVGAAKMWIDTSVSPHVLKSRNAANTAWENIAASSLPPHDHTTTAGTGDVLTNDEHDGYSEYAEIASPATPASGKVRIYPKADGLPYSKDDAGTEVGLANPKVLGQATVGTTQVAVAHGLGYTPTIVLLLPTSAGQIWRSAVSDSTNIYLTADAAARTCIPYVR